MTSETLIAVGAAAAFFLGVLVGYLYGQYFSNRYSSERNAKKEISDSEEKLKAFQHEVNSHFAALSTHSANINESYRGIQEYLASSAIKLASPEVSQQILKVATIDDNFGSGNIGEDQNNESLEPPRDYAPKVPGGVLSEEYGLSNPDQYTAKPTEIEPSVKEDSTDPTLNIT